MAFGYFFQMNFRSSLSNSLYKTLFYTFLMPSPYEMCNKSLCSDLHSALPQPDDWPMAACLSQV